MPTRLALAGATGYIGHNLLNELKKKYDVIALSRNGDDKDNEERVEWRSCDLFSLDDTIAGMKGADIAVYLVHSMMPSAKLTQGSFENMDLLLADNFARAAKENGIRQIIYLSGSSSNASPSWHSHDGHVTRHTPSLYRMSFMHLVKVSIAMMLKTGQSISVDRKR